MSIKFLSKNKIAVLVSLALCSTCLGAPAPTTQDKKWFASFGIGHGSMQVSGPETLSGYSNISRNFANKGFAYNMSVGCFLIPSVAIEGSIGGFVQKLDYTANSNKTTRVAYVLSKDGSTLLMPVSLVLQYHIRIVDKITPYLGVGYSYQLGTTYKTKNNWRWIFLNDPDEVEIQGGGGPLLQAGIDFALDAHQGSFLNLDVKYTHKVKHDLVMSRLSREIFRDPLKISTLAVTAGLKVMF